jgi:predicted nucleic acid-binding protein
VPGDFVDSNVLVYAFTSDPRAAMAQSVLERGCTTSVQGLNEFANVARRKLRMTWTEVTEALAAIRTVCRTIVPIDIETHADAMSIAERYGVSVFDALMIASAARAECDVLFSEDMQSGLVVAGRLRIVNPFRA